MQLPKKLREIYGFHALPEDIDLQQGSHRKKHHAGACAGYQAVLYKDDLGVDRGHPLVFSYYEPVYVVN